MRSLWLLLVVVSLPRPADAGTCMFDSGGTIHSEIPLGCPIGLYHSLPSTRMWTEFGLYRGGVQITLPVTAATVLAPRTVPVQVTVSTPPSCGYHFETEERTVHGIALAVDGLQVGDAVSYGSVIVAAGPCPSDLAAPTNTAWLHCTPPNDYDLCCAKPDAECGGLPPDPNASDDSGGCAATNASLGAALALLALRRRRTRRT